VKTNHGIPLTDELGAALPGPRSMKIPSPRNRNPFGVKECAFLVSLQDPVHKFRTFPECKPQSTVGSNGKRQQNAARRGELRSSESQQICGRPNAQEWLTNNRICCEPSATYLPLPFHSNLPSHCLTSRLTNCLRSAAKNTGRTLQAWSKQSSRHILFISRASPESRLKIWLSSSSTNRLASYGLTGFLSTVLEHPLVWPFSRAPGRRSWQRAPRAHKDPGLPGRQKRG
jgi:hypothetical protein